MVGQDARRGQNKETSWSGSMGGFLEEGANLRRSKPAVCVGGGYSKGTRTSSLPLWQTAWWGPEWRKSLSAQGPAHPLWSPRSAFQPSPQVLPLSSLSLLLSLPCPGQQRTVAEGLRPPEHPHVLAPDQGSARRAQCPGVWPGSWEEE